MPALKLPRIENSAVPKDVNPAQMAPAVFHQAQSRLLLIGGPINLH